MSGNVCNAKIFGMITRSLWRNSNQLPPLNQTKCWELILWVHHNGVHSKMSTCWFLLIITHDGLSFSPCIMPPLKVLQQFLTSWGVPDFIAVLWLPLCVFKLCSILGQDNLCYNWKSCSGCVFMVCVCVFTAVCVHFGWVKCRV